MEYQVRTLNRDGDSIDPEMFPRLPRAMERFNSVEFAGNIVAVVVEKSTSWWQDDGNKVDEIYETLGTRGDIQALKAGGWID